MYRPSGNVTDPAAAHEFLAIAREMNQLRGLEVLHAPPQKPLDGQVALSDGTDWDPVSAGVRKPVWYNAEDDTWNAF